MSEIELTRGKVAIVDDERFAELYPFTWQCNAGGYATRAESRDGKDITIYMHKQIMGCLDEVDHKNGNTLDNRIENLRMCHHWQNGGNRKLNKNASSGFKGITWHEKTGKWMAQITCQGKRRHIGLFSNRLEAARAYDSAAVELFGEFASTNKMLGLIP